MFPTDIRIIEHLEGVAVGNPALSKAVLKTIGWDWECMGCPGGGMWKRADDGLHCGPLPAVTENAAAARALVPERLEVMVKVQPGKTWEVRLFEVAEGSTAMDSKLATVAEGATLALALCGAAVKLACASDVATGV